MPKTNRSLYQFADQFARLEAVRAYIQAAGEILAEAQSYENRNPDPTYVRKGVTASASSLRTAHELVQKLMRDMEGDLAVEGGEKESLPPTDTSKPTEPEAFKPTDSTTLDDTFSELFK